MSRAKETQTNCALTFESVAEKEQQPPSTKLAAAFLINFDRPQSASSIDRKAET